MNSNCWMIWIKAKNSSISTSRYLIIIIWSKTEYGMRRIIWWRTLDFLPGSNTYQEVNNYLKAVTHSVWRQKWHHNKNSQTWIEKVILEEGMSVIWMNKSEKLFMTMIWPEGVLFPGLGTKKIIEQSMLLDQIVIKELSRPPCPVKLRTKNLNTFLLNNNLNNQNKNHTFWSGISSKLKKKSLMKWRRS